jgi:hypothetical protein
MSEILLEQYEEHKEIVNENVFRLMTLMEGVEFQGAEYKQYKKEMKPWMDEWSNIISPPEIECHCGGHYNVNTVASHVTINRHVIYNMNNNN